MNKPNAERDNGQALETHPSQGYASAPPGPQASLQSTNHSQGAINYSANPSAYNSAVGDHPGNNDVATTVAESRHLQYPSLQASQPNVEPPYPTIASVPAGNPDQSLYPTMPMNVPWQGSPAQYGTPPVSTSPYPQQTAPPYGPPSQMGTAWPQYGQPLPYPAGSWASTGFTTPVVSQPIGCGPVSDSAYPRQPGLSAQHYPTNMASPPLAQNTVQQGEVDTTCEQCCGYACCTCLAHCCCALLVSCISEHCKSN